MITFDCTFKVFRRSPTFHERITNEVFVELFNLRVKSRCD